MLRSGEHTSYAVSTKTIVAVHQGDTRVQPVSCTVCLRCGEIWPIGFCGCDVFVWNEGEA
jgi:hypothetical protein